jgi:hypothetical protein
LIRFLLNTVIFCFVIVEMVCAQEKNLYLFYAKQNKSHEIRNNFKLHYQSLTDTAEKSVKLLSVINDSIILLKDGSINISNISFVRRTTTAQKIQKGFGGFLLGIGGYIILGSLYEMTKKDSPHGENWKIPPGFTLLIGSFFAFPGYVMLDTDSKKYILGVRYKLIIQ